MTELEVCSPLINLHLIWLKYSLRYMLCVTVLHYCFNYNNWQTDDKANYCRLLTNMKKVLVYPNITRGCNFIAFEKQLPAPLQVHLPVCGSLPVMGGREEPQVLSYPYFQGWDTGTFLPSVFSGGNITMSSWYREEIQIVSHVSEG